MTDKVIDRVTALAEHVNQCGGILSREDGGDLDEVLRRLARSEDEIERLRADTTTHKNNETNWRDRAQYAEQLNRKLNYQSENDGEHIRRLEKLHEERDAIGRDLSEKVEALIAGNDELRAALGRIAGMEKPPAGFAQQVALMKEIAISALGGS